MERTLNLQGSSLIHVALSTVQRKLNTSWDGQAHRESLAENYQGRTFAERLSRQRLKRNI